MRQGAPDQRLRCQVRFSDTVIFQRYGQFLLYIVKSIHSKFNAMTKFNPDLEAKIAIAVREWQKQPGQSYAKFAAQFRVPVRQFKARLQGRLAQNSKGGQNKALNNEQEARLRSYINFLIFIGYTTTKKHILLAANSILKHKGQNRHVNMQ